MPRPALKVASQPRATPQSPTLIPCEPLLVTTQSEMLASKTALIPMLALSKTVQPEMRQPDAARMPDELACAVQSMMLQPSAQENPLPLFSMAVQFLTVDPEAAAIDRKSVV